jgi:outer membrane receptor protein involved in Fe transport
MKPVPAHLLRLPLLALSVLSLSIPLLRAQSTVAPVKKEDEVVALSPFVVNAESEEGYYSPSAVSGTRTRTELINLPMNMTVFNENFINDIGARDLVDIVSFASGVSGAATASSDNAGGDTLGFVLRGQGAFVPNRNGFRRLRVVDPVTISRVEVLKGPASVLYGQASPGGSVNYITKRPVQRRLLSTTLQAGSYDFYKASMDVNVPTANQKLAVRFVGSYEDSQSWIARYHNWTTVLYPSVTWWIRPETTLTFEYESTIKRQNPQSPLPFHPLLKPDDQPWAVDLSFNARGLHDWFDVTMKAKTLEFVHKFNPNLTVRLNATNESWVDNVRTNSPSNTITSIAGGAPTNPPTLPGRAFNHSSRGSFDDYRQIELLNNFEFHGIEVQNLLGYQLGKEKFVQIYAGIAPAIDNSSLWNLNDPSTWIPTERLEDLGSATSTGNFARNTLNAVYFTNQLTMFNGKVHTLLGVRSDKIDSDGISNANTAAPVQSYASYPRKRSPQIGILYKPVEGLSFFGSYSTSIVNLYTTIARNPDGSFFNPVPGTGKGFDYGVKVDKMKGKLSGVLSFYELEETDIIRQLPQVTVNGELFTPSVQNGTNRSSGVELDLQWRPYKKTQLGIAYAYTYAYVESDDAAAVTLNGVRTLSRVNHQLAYSPKHQFSFNARQDLGALGFFKNVYVTGNGRWVDTRQYTEAYFVNNGVLTAPWTFDPYMVFSAGIGGQFDLGKINYSASLMVKNLFDERYYASRNYFGNPRTIEFTLRAKF